MAYRGGVSDHIYHSFTLCAIYDMAASQSAMQQRKDQMTRRARKKAAAKEEESKGEQQETTMSCVDIDGVLKVYAYMPGSGLSGVTTRAAYVSYKDAAYVCA